MKKITLILVCVVALFYFLCVALSGTFYPYRWPEEYKTTILTVVSLAAFFEVMAFAIVAMAKTTVE